MSTPARSSLPSPDSPHQPADAGQRALLRDAARDGVAMAALLLALATLAAWAAGLGADYVIKVSVFYGVGVVVVAYGLRTGAHPHRRFGPANRVTLGRLAMGTLLAALLGEAVLTPPLRSDALGWAVVVLATLTAVLDAADGALARRSGLVSRFGARFDMETDTAFMLALAALVWQAGQAGPWILAAGLMRYAFVAAAVALPWLSGPLPPRRRRQAVCVIQITCLIICLGPIVPPPLAQAIAAASLLLLTLSFVIDIRFLARARNNHPTQETTTC